MGYCSKIDVSKLKSTDNNSDSLEFNQHPILSITTDLVWSRKHAYNNDEYSTDAGNTGHNNQDEYSADAGNGPEGRSLYCLNLNCRAPPGRFFRLDLSFR
jgi:hypothetical protein